MVVYLYRVTSLPTPGLSRAIAQVVGYDLIPWVLGRVVESSAEGIPEVGGGNSEPGQETRDDQSTFKYHMSTDKAALLRCLWTFLDSNSEVAKLRRKQRRFFEEYALEEKVTLRGLLSMPPDLSGERVPVHLLTTLADAVKSVTQDIDSDTNTITSGLTASLDADVNSVSGTVPSSKLLQNKRFPSSSLELDVPINGGVDVGDEQEAGDKEGFGRMAAEALQQYRIIFGDALNHQESSARAERLERRRRQPVIVCASLLDKVTNLAGIARTCEVRTL